MTEVVSLLKRYRSISVRENQTVRYMLDLGLSFVTQDLDPTLLLTAEDWKRLFDIEVKVSYNTYSFIQLRVIIMILFSTGFNYRAGKRIEIICGYCCRSFN